MIPRQTPAATSPTLNRRTPRNRSDSVQYMGTTQAISDQTPVCLAVSTLHF